MNGRLVSGFEAKSDLFAYTADESNEYFAFSTSDSEIMNGIDLYTVSGEKINPDGWYIYMNWQ